MMKLTNTGKGAVLLSIGDGVEIAAGASETVDAKAWADLKGNPVVASWIADGRIVEDGATEAPAPKVKKVVVKDAE